MNNIPTKLNTVNSYKFKVGEAILILFFALLIGQIIGGLFVFIKTPPTLKGIIIATSYFAGFGSSALLIMLIKKLPFRELPKFFISQKKPLLFIFAAVLLLVSLPFTEFLGSLIPTDIPFLQKLYQSLEKTFNDIILNTPVSGFITVCIFAPILEELIFRGLLLKGLLNNKVNPWLSIVVVGLLFGLSHGNPWQFVGAGFLGVLFGFIYWRTKDLVICVFLHALNNSLSFFVALQNKGIEQDIFENQPDKIYLMAGISLILLLLSGYQFYKYTQKNTQSLWS